MKWPLPHHINAICDEGVAVEKYEGWVDICWEKLRGQKRNQREQGDKKAIIGRSPRRDLLLVVHPRVLLEMIPCGEIPSRGQFMYPKKIEKGITC